MKSFLLAVVLINVVFRVAECRPVANSSAVEQPQRRHDHHGHGGHHDHGGHHHPDNKKRSTHKLFVFGDEAADNGNVDSDPRLGFPSRGWRYPFGSSDKVHGRKPTGRLSDGLVQSDFVAMIMGHRESPPAYNSDDWDDDAVDASGMNFALAGARALKAQGVPTLRKQVQQLRGLVNDGVVRDEDFKGSVALVAYSGNDYGDAHDGMTLGALVTEVVDELSSVVSDLLDLGVAKVLVNTLPPFGCSSWQAKRLEYRSCADDDANEGSDKHNAALRDRLGDEAEDVMLLDMDTVFTDLVAEGSTLSAEFSERLRPCCESFDDDGYCGQDNRYSICERPEEYFYWDFFSPTQAGWRAVMRLLQGPIMAFLGISNLNHF
ncbi:hypothetical protein BS78_02G005500 [Paspalum vaginatum]|nr:hypothetical protein BS78_02G005500 [Paspalum vaginatum]